MTSLILALILAFPLRGAPAAAGGDGEARMLIDHVAASGRHIVFSYAGDLWRVERAGGKAQQLTSGPAEDDFPVYSMDGLNIAFSRRTGDDWDVYVIDPQGDEPQRLTWNPELDIARGWTPDGRVLFVSHRDEELSFRLYTIASDPSQGTLPAALPLPRGWEGSYAPDGDRIAYVPIAWPAELMGVGWKHYRGGMASRIWIAKLATSEIERLPRGAYNERNPMWVGGAIYFVSDSSGTSNLYRYDTETRLVEQLTRYETYGVESAAAGGNAIVFVQDGRIRVLDTATDAVETVEVEVDPDTTELKPKTVGGSRWILSAAPSPSGDHVVFDVRGDVVTFDPESALAVNLTSTPGVAERDPVYSPDGKWIAYFSDETGQYELRVRPAGGAGEPRTIHVELQPTYYREITWSPDSKRISFTDMRLRLWVADVETGGARRVTTSHHSNQGLYHPSWSPDGVWMAYSRYEANGLRAIYVYHADRGRQRRITSARVDAERPIFDKSGNYLYFIASNDAPLGEFGWSVLSGKLFRPLITRRLQLVMLRQGVAAPIYPVTGQINPNAGRRSTPPPAAREQPGEPGGLGQPGARAPGAGRPIPQGGGRTVINLSRIESRIVPLPLPARDYSALAAAGPGVIFVLVTKWPDAPGAGHPSGTLYRYQLSEPKKLTRWIENVDEFSVTADGSQILYRSGSNWALVSTREAPEAGAGRIATGALNVQVQPAAEWREMYHEAFRLMNDYFYDPNHHGQDLEALESHYASYLPSVTRRRDLNALIGKAFGHVSVSHLVVSGGDIPPADPGSRIGMLGVDYEVSEGLYRIARIYRSGHYNSLTPLLQAPLDQPGVFVRQGDYLLAVDGKPITADRNIYSYFEGTSLTPTKITVAPSPDGTGARTYTVVPLPGENVLRRMNWAEYNRGVVEQESEGILGYIYIPGFSAGGLETVFRQLLESRDRRGLIIDQRFATGGITADWLIEWLARKPLYYYAFRHGDDLAIPTNPLPEAKVLMINDVDGSAAETFALMFGLAHVGKTVGTRTAGAGAGPYAYMPRLIDGGRISVPSRAAFDPAGSWAIENAGIQPDVEVEWLPAEWREGRDPQLEAAIHTVLQAIVDKPPLEVKRPEYPVYGNK